MKKISIFIITLIITTMSFGFLCTAYASERVYGSKGNYYAELSETRALSRYVYAVVWPMGSGASDVTYYWDTEPTNTSLQGTSSYTFTSNGQHRVKLYTGKHGYPDYLQDEITFNFTNIDNTVPTIGNIRTKIVDGKWNITLEGCSDNVTSSSSLRSMCMSSAQAAGYRQASGWNDDSLRSTGGWSTNMSYTKDEGTYCLFLMDEAGNIAERDYNTGHQDTTPPVFTEDPVIENEGGENGYTHAVLITVNAEDNEMMNAYPYSFNAGGTWQEGNQLRVVENGTVQIKSRDNAGNESEVLEIEVNNIDNDPPVISINQKEDDRTDGSVEISMSASDSLSGVSELSYQNDAVGIPVVIAGGDGSASESKGTSVTINQNGTYTFFAKDLLGNISSAQVNVVKAVKTEYRDPENKNAGSGSGEGNKDSNGNRDSNGNKDIGSKKDKNKENSSKNKDDKKDKNNSGTTTIISTGNGTNEQKSVYTSPNAGGTGTESKIVISGGDDSKQEKASEKTSKGDNGKSSKSQSRTITVSSPDSKENGKSGISTYSIYDGEISTLPDDYSSTESSAESADSEEEPEIREVTLDEYLAGPNDKDLHEEEILPELMENEDGSTEKKSNIAGKVVMTCVILFILAVLTLLLLTAKGVIPIPSIDADDEEDEETGDLSVIDRIRGIFTK